MLNLIMNLLGYENINKIMIPYEFRKPKQFKLEAKKKMLSKYGILPEIIIDENYLLIDGFCSYFIASAYNIKYVKVRKVKCKKQ